MLLPHGTKQSSGNCKGRSLRCVISSALCLQSGHWPGYGSDDRDLFHLHNGYAEKLGSIGTDIAVIKNDIKTLYKQA